MANDNKDVQTAPEDGDDHTNFIADEIEADLASSRYTRPICTRFPPEPNGYMHLGHAKAATVGHDLAARFDGIFNLRLDDTNPAAEEEEFAQAMVDDIEWLLGRSMDGRVFQTSDYFEQLYTYAEQLVNAGHAYVDDLTTEEIKEYRGDFHKPGRPSPHRERPVAENLALLRAMRAGEFKPGEKVLRAKIDPAHPNMNMRDPLIYRVLDQEHHRAGKWHIYPLYDYAHPLSDAIEGVTHSTCGKEFANHRPLYDWFLESLELKEPPRQIEFSEIGVEGVVLAKRHMRRLVELGKVSGWDDPRMPTMRGLRRRGYTPAAIRDFCEGLGVSSGGSPGKVDLARLEHHVREDLNASAPRVMGVLRPLKVVLENYPEDQVEQLEAVNIPDDPESGTRMRPFSRELFVDRSDFMEDPPKKWHRLTLGKEVRLRYGYLITCTEVIKDPSTGEVVELRATYDPETRGGDAPDGRKVRGTLHWVSAAQAVAVEARLYTELFLETVSEFDGSQPIESFLNPESLEVLTDSVVEPSAADLPVGAVVQFERTGYFCVDADSEGREGLVFNRTVGLKDGKFRKIFR